MSFKSYADAVSGSSREEKSVAKLCNTFWRKYQVEDEEDAFAKAIESSKVSTRCHEEVATTIEKIIQLTPRAYALVNIVTVS